MISSFRIPNFVAAPAATVGLWSAATFSTIRGDSPKRTTAQWVAPLIACLSLLLPADFATAEALYGIMYNGPSGSDSSYTFAKISTSGAGAGNATPIFSFLLPYQISGMAHDQNTGKFVTVSNAGNVIEIDAVTFAVTSLAITGLPPSPFTNFQGVEYDPTMYLPGQLPSDHILVTYGQNGGNPNEQRQIAAINPSTGAVLEHTDPLCITDGDAIVFCNGQLIEADTNEFCFRVISDPFASPTCSNYSCPNDGEMWEPACSANGTMYFSNRSTQSLYTLNVLGDSYVLVGPHWPVTPSTAWAIGLAFGPDVFCQCDGDMDNDADTDLTDLSIVGNCVQCDGAPNPKCDVNCDGVVNFRDFGAEMCLVFTPGEACCSLPYGKCTNTDLFQSCVDVPQVTCDDVNVDGTFFTGVLCPPRLGDCNGNGTGDGCEPQCTSDLDCDDGLGCTCDRCNSCGVCDNFPRRYADANCDCLPPNLDDLLCVLTCFSTARTSCSNANIHPPCDGLETNGPQDCDVDDILAVLSAFAGENPCFIECSTPCPVGACCGLNGTPPDTCNLRNRTDCLSGSDNYHGDGTLCPPFGPSCP